MKIYRRHLIFTLAAFFLLAFDISGQKGDGEIRKELIGVWQSAPVVASGMDDNFQFFADGKYRFNYNQMDGTKRILSYAGKWSVEEGKLVLTVEKMTLLFGGKRVAATGSTATDYQIEGGKVIDVKLETVEKTELPLGKFVREELHNTTAIDGVKYWKLAADPRAYES